MKALSPLIQADRSHRYGYTKAVLGLFPCGQWTEDCPPLHLRLSALVSLNSRGMVVTPYNRLDAPDVHARQAHHRTSGGSPPLLPSSGDGGQGTGVRKCVIKHKFNMRLHIPQSRGGLPSLAPQGGRGVFRRTKGACSPFGNPNLADFQPKRISFNAKSRNLTKTFRRFTTGNPINTMGARIY